MVLALLPVVLVTGFLDSYYVGWRWFVLRWSVFITFLYLWAKEYETWLAKRRAARANRAPRQGPPSP